MEQPRPRLVVALLALTLAVVAAFWFFARQEFPSTGVAAGHAATLPDHTGLASPERLVVPGPADENPAESLPSPPGWGSLEVRLVAPGLERLPPATTVELIAEDGQAISLPPAGESEPGEEPGLTLFPEVAAGRHLLRVSSSHPFGSLEQEVEVRSNERSRLEVVLEPRFLLRVRVVAGTPGEAADAIPGAVVQLIAHESWLRRLGAEKGSSDAEPPRSASTAADGTTSFDDVPRGRFVLSAAAPGRVVQDRLLEFTAADLDEERFLSGQELLVRLPRTAHGLQGSVHDARGRPLPGCLVCLGPDPREPQSPRFPRKGGGAFVSRAAPAFAVTDAEGRFEMQVPAEQEGSVLLVCPGDPDLPPVYPFLAWVKTERPRPLRLSLPDCPRVQLFFQDEGGAPGRGDVRIEDQRLTVTHLGEDPYLSRVPAFAERFEPPRTPGQVDLHLRPGVYRVHHVEGEVKHSYHLRVDAGSDVYQTYTLAGE